MENRPTIPNRTGFADLMRPGERIAALVYLPIHVFALPLLLPYLVYAVPDITAVDVNLTYYVIGFVYVLALCWRFLRAGFDAALDRLARQCSYGGTRTIGTFRVLDEADMRAIFAAANGR